MIAFFSSLAIKDVILYLGGCIIGLLIYIYRSDLKELKDDFIELKLEVKENKNESQQKRTSMQKAVDLRIDDVYFELDKYEDLKTTVTENQKDIEWLKKQ